MERNQNQETTSFVPIITQLDRLDRVLKILEEKHNSMSSSRRDVCAVESSNDCKTLFSALEEVQHKGTLIDRLALLENRVLQLSLEMDEGNTSRSSSSTAQISIPIPKRQDDDNHCLHFNTKQMQHPSTTHQERTYPANGFVKKTTAQHKGKGQKKKPKKRWLGMFRLIC